MALRNKSVCHSPIQTMMFSSVADWCCHSEAPPGGISSNMVQLLLC